MSDPASVPAAVDGTAFRHLMGRWPTGVAVVTARSGDRDFGLTVNAFLSVSLAPPLLLISLTHDADTTPVIVEQRAFAVHLLAHDQRAVSERFAAMSEPEAKFAGLPFHRGASGIPRLDGVLASLECRVERTIPVADHLLIVGAVTDLELGRDVGPLLFFRSHYADSPDGERVVLPPPGSPKAP